MEEKKTLHSEAPDTDIDELPKHSKKRGKIEGKSSETADEAGDEEVHE